MAKTSTLRLDIRKALAESKFKNNLTKAEDILVRAIEDALFYRANPHASYKGKKVTRISFGTDRPKGRKDETLIRAIVISALFQSWQLEFEKSPRINNKGYRASPFVIFAELIFRIANIGKVEDHLEEYRSFRKQAIKNFHVK